MTGVAIKALRRSVTDDEEELVNIRRRLLREIRVWALLEHPNITPFLGVINGFRPLSAMVSPYYAKAKINQYTLDNPDAERLPLLVGVAKGLAYLHSLGVIHGDLKGNNILIDDDCSPRLADFGISKVIARSGFDTPRIGTIRYMAPELTVISDHFTDPIPPADLSSDNTTKKSDTYAFAMVVIEILTSKLPFFYLREEHLVVILTQDGKRPDRRQCLPTHFADEIWQFMEDCWHHDPRARPEMAATIPRLEKMRSNKLRVAWEDVGPVPVSGSVPPQ
ncbi:kinase-like protein [Athelia psychrophila]|uniref:Kinase-like protein n=1 Tax=Athelia psychrophila TaxID=1759441 RepID=A0A166P7K0_9AGAM|nr:kinase-like protein [Fibularhizoctonia sp. CBS 109695]